MPKRTILSNLQFHDYLAIISHMGGEGVHAPHAGAGGTNDDNLRVFYESSLRFLDVCDQRREKLRRDARHYWLCNVQDLVKGCGLPEVPEGVLKSALSEALEPSSRMKWESRLSVLRKALSPHISPSGQEALAEKLRQVEASSRNFLTPLSTISFGQTDNLSIILGDDFDYAAWMLEEPELPIKQVCVSLCPQMRSLQIATGEGTPFLELEELFSCGRVASGDSQDWRRIPHFPGWEGFPLVGVTYFRTTGLCNLGSGLLWHEAIMRESARRIESVLRRIKPDGRIISRKDLGHYKCAFLWPVGWADFCLVSFTSNYSLIVSVLHELRQMTFDHLFKAMDGVYEKDDHGEDFSLERLADAFSVHEAFARLENQHRSQEAWVETSRESPNLLRRNHVFCSTSTTLCVEHHAFMEMRERQPWNGLVSADPHFNVSPGHLAELNARKDLRLGKKNLYENRGTVGSWFVAGLFDSSDRSSFAPRSRHATSLRNLLARVRLLRGEKHYEGPGFSIWPVEDLFTEIHVPLPAIEPERDTGILTTTVHPSHVSLFRLLAELRSRVFEEADGNANPGELCIQRLKQRLKDIRMPSPLSTAIVSLYVDFAKSMNDPLLFDNVLDLYDLFRAVFRVLTKEMPDELERFVKGIGDDPILGVSRRLSYVDEVQVRELTALVNLMENALQRRTQMGFRQARQWQEALDMRGGLNHLISAADVPLKCGLSVLRRVLRGQAKDVFDHDVFEEDEYRNDQDTRGHLFRARIGGASKISYHSSAITRRFDLGEPKKNFIADLSINVAHLTRPMFLVAHLHETGHLLCELIRRDSADTSDAPPRRPYCNQCLGQRCFRYESPQTRSAEELEERERHEEIFAEMFTYGILFHDCNSADSTVTYLRFYLGMFFLDAISMNVDSAISLRRFAEVAIRGFMALDPWAMSAMGGKTGSATYEPGERVTPDLKSASDRFVKMLEASGPLHFEFRRFWRGENKEYILRRFGTMYMGTFRPLCCIWDDVRRIVESVCKPVDMAGIEGTNPCEDDLKGLLEDFENAYKEGRPIVRFLYTHRDWEKASERIEHRKSQGEKCKHLDALFVMRHILRVHIEDLFARIDTKKETCFSWPLIPLVGTNHQMLDRGYNGLVSADFETRASYLRGRVSVLATLWDLSTAIRARILMRIVQAHTDVYPPSDILASEKRGREQMKAGTSDGPPSR